MPYRRADGITWDVSEDRAVVLDAGGSTLITLNPVGTLLWQELQEPLDVDRLTTALRERFPDVADAQLRADVEAFVHELVDEGLLVDDRGPD